jgi:YHS domain-containing protein
VSGVVFRVEEARPHREVGGRKLYFCCESCADHFAKHAEAVLAARGIRVE